MLLVLHCLDPLLVLMIETPHPVHTHSRYSLYICWYPNTQNPSAGTGQLVRVLAGSCTRTERLFFDSPNLSRFAVESRLTCANITSYGRANGSSDDENDDSRNDDDGRRRFKFGFLPSRRRRREEEKRHDNAAAPLATIYRLYVDYLRRLWSKTDVDHRRSVARCRARDAITNV